LPDRAVAVVVAADRGSRARNREAPACGAVLAGTAPPSRKRCALIADADQSRSKDVAEVAVWVPAGGREAVTAEVRDIASADQAALAPDGGVVQGEVPVLVRAEVPRGISVAARHPALGEEANPVRAEARVSVPVGVEECILDAPRDIASAADVDSAPAPSTVEVRVLGLAAEVDSAPVPKRAEGRVLDPAGSQIKRDQAEVVGRVAVRVLALAGRVADLAPVPDRVEVQASLAQVHRPRQCHPKRRTEMTFGGRREVVVRALALAVGVADSVPTDVPMSTYLPRPSRNRKLHQKRRRVQRNLWRSRKMLRNKKVLLNNDGAWQQGCLMQANGHGWKRAVIVCAQMRETDCVRIPLLQLVSECDLA
jgi:hypothetical protein